MHICRPVTIVFFLLFLSCVLTFGCDHLYFTKNLDGLLINNKGRIVFVCFLLTSAIIDLVCVLILCRSYILMVIKKY